MRTLHLPILFAFSAAIWIPLNAKAHSQTASFQQQCPAAQAWINQHKAQAKTQRDTRRKEPSRPLLRKKLLGMEAADIAARRALTNATKKHDEHAVAQQQKNVLRVDARHLATLRSLLGSQGFPTPPQVGDDGVDAAFILIQHADADPVFQARMLPQLKRLHHKGQIPGKDLALLTDRVRRAQHKPQLYGTQFQPSPDGDSLHLGPVAEPSTLAARRAGMGLMPLKDYACVLSTVYGKPVSMQPSSATSK